MDSGIVPKDSMNIKEIPTFEEFKELCSTEVSAKSTFNEWADVYDRIPLPVRVLKNFDPTGVLSSFADALAEIKAKRKEEKLWITSYELFKALCVINQKIERINPEYFESQIITLTEMYFDYSMRAYQFEKIEIFRNAFLTGVMDYDKTLEEKENIFDLISSLSLDQIRILKYCYDNKDKHNMIQTRWIAHELGRTESYVDQLCLSLNGKGLLYGIPSSKPMHGERGYGYYHIGNFLEYLIKYIKEPSDLNITTDLKYSLPKEGI